MNYKETFYFIAKCLTLTLESKNKEEIKKQLISNTIDWDGVVKISTNHYVLPALFCNLYRANFLHYLPKDLVDYMKYITKLNKERNLKIITQAKNLNKLLIANKIRPIFLKGTANLLAGIYEDIAERMVGDIDFIFSEKDYPKAITLLKNNEYREVEKYDYSFSTENPFFPGEKHYPRLEKEDQVAAIEIHHKILVKKKYLNEFNYSLIEKDCQIVDKIRILSYSNKLKLTIIANQINDSGFKFKNIPLRNAYDVFILSKKTNAKAAVNTLERLNHPLNCFLAACFEIFSQADSLKYNVNKKTGTYLGIFKKQFANIKATKSRWKMIQIYLFLMTRLDIIYKSIFYKKYRAWLVKRIRNKNWRKQKIANLIFKKYLAK